MSMSDEAEKAWDEYASSGWGEMSEWETFMAGRTSRDAEVAELRQQLAEREAVIERVRDLCLEESSAIRTRCTPGSLYAGYANACDDVLDALDASPSTVLADLIREKQAEAWSERGRDTFPFASKPNPYWKETGQ